MRTRNMHYANSQSALISCPQTKLLKIANTQEKRKLRKLRTSLVGKRSALCRIIQLCTSVAIWALYATLRHRLRFHSAICTCVFQLRAPAMQKKSRSRSGDAPARQLKRRKSEETLVMQKIAKIKPALQDILRRACDPEAPVLQLRDEAKKLLKSVDLITPTRMKSSRVGVHRMNRYGDGIIPARVHALLTGIFDVGFSETSMDEPWAMEMPPPEHPRHDELRLFNVNMCIESGGRLPEYEEDGMWIALLSLTCGHTSQTFRIVEEGVPHENEKITVDGRLSLEQLRMRQPQYAAGIDAGIKWNRLPWQLEDECPEIVDLFQEAGNLPGQLQSGTSRFETILKIHKCAQRKATTMEGAAPDDVWAAVATEATRNSAFKEEVEDLAKFARYLSGGLEDPVFLNYVRDFLRTLENERIVRGPVIAAIATVAVGGQAHAAPNLRIACYMACTGASYAYTRNGEQTLLQPSDIMQLTKKLSVFALQAEKMLVEVKAMIANWEHQGLSAQQSASLKCLRHLTAVRLVHHMYRKPDESRGVFKTMGDIGHRFIEGAATVLNAPLSSPWAPVGASLRTPPKAGPTAHAPASSSALMVEFKGDAIANNAELLGQAGYQIDSQILRKSDDTKFKITALNAEFVEVADEADEKYNIPYDGFEKKSTA